MWTSRVSLLPLRSGIGNFISFFLFPLLLFSEELEIHLSTRNPAKPLYLSQIHTGPTETDWRYCEEVRGILEQDLAASGYCSIVSRREELEETFHFPEVRANFDLTKWKREKIPFAIAVQIFQNRLSLTLFNTEQGTSKKYPDISLSGELKSDRKLLHRMADLLQRDLFGREGISSLQILYTQRVKNFSDPKGPSWFSEVWVSDADGGNARQLTRDKSYCLSPIFLSSTEFLYVSEKTGQSKIYRASLSDPTGVLAVELRGNQALPALAPKQTQLAFITDVAGRPDLFIQNLDAKGKMAGKARQLYSSPRATQASPTYSPDGKKLAFVSDKDGPPRIYQIDVVKQKETQKLTPRLLTTKNRENTSPAWSPDGKKLAFSAKVDGIRQIWIYDFETQEEIQLTSSPVNKENAAWAPDSFHLVYNTESDEECELYQIHLNGAEPLRIGKGRFACWEPR